MKNHGLRERCLPLLLKQLDDKVASCIFLHSEQGSLSSRFLRSLLFLVLVCSLQKVTLAAIVSVVSETPLFPQQVISTSHGDYVEQFVRRMDWKCALVCGYGDVSKVLTFAPCWL